MTFLRDRLRKDSDGEPVDGEKFSMSKPYPFSLSFFAVITSLAMRVVPIKLTYLAKDGERHRRGETADDDARIASLACLHAKVGGERENDLV